MITAFIFICCVSILIALGNSTGRWTGGAQGYTPPRPPVFWKVLGALAAVAAGFVLMVALALGWLAHLIGMHS